MAYDAHANGAYGVITVAPSPATSGASVTLQGGQGASMPTPPFNATVKPFGVLPLFFGPVINSEIVRATAISTTTVASASNGASLPQSTINVASTTGFQSSGTFTIASSNGPQIVTYTGLTSNTFTGCTGGIGTLSTGGAITGDRLTIARAQESTTAQNIAVGWEIAATITKKTIVDIEIYTQSKVSIVVGVHGDLGYITDGVDDQVQINQALIDANAAGGGIVWIPDISYSIYSSIIPQNKTWLRGSGMYITYLFGTAALTTGAIIDTFPALALTGDFSNPLTDFMYSDMTIDGSNMVPTGQPITDAPLRKGTQISNTLRLRVQNVRTQNTVASGFGNDFAEEALYDNCIAYNCGTEAFDPGYNGFGIGLGKPNESIEMVNCYAINCGNNGFLFEKQFSIVFETYPRNYLLTNCHSIGCRRGFRFSSANGVTLTNCKATSATTYGFDFESGGQFSVPNDVTLIGVEAYNNGATGIRFDADSRIANVILDGVRSFSNTGDGISLNGTKAEMNNINCHNNRDCGIEIAGSSWAQFQIPIKSLKLSNVVCANNGQSNTNGNAHGIRISGGTERISSISLTNVSCYDDQATATQLHGIHIEDDVSKVLLNSVEAYGNAYGGIYADITGVIVNDYQLVHVKTYNNNRGGASSTAGRIEGIYINADTATGGYLDRLKIQDVHAYDDQTSLVPQAPIVSVYALPTVVSGNLNGNYTYKVTFVNAIGETKGGATSSVIGPANNQVKITTLPLGPAGTTARKIYRTAAGGADGTQKLVATVSDNTTTTYVDNIADGSLGATVPTVNTDGTTNTPVAPITAIYTPDTPVAGNLTGTYKYKITFVTALGETAGGYTATVSGLSSGQVKVYIPLGPGGTTSRKLYRTAAGGADGTQKLVTTITGNDPTSSNYLYLDNIVDGSLGAAVPTNSTAYAATQKYGISLAGNISNAEVRDNDVRGNVTAGMLLDSTVTGNLTNVFLNNKGWNSDESYSLGTISGSTLTINRANGKTQYATLANNSITVAITAGVNDGDELVMVLAQDSTGSRAITWPSNFVGGPVLTTTGSTVDVITAVWDKATSKWRKTGHALNRAVSIAEGGTGATTASAALLNLGIGTVTSTSSSSTPTPTGDSRENELYITALAVGATFGAPTGTPTNGNKLVIRIKDNGTAQTLAWNGIYRAVGITLPTTTVINKTLYLGCKYNSADSLWDVIALAQEA